MTSFQPIPPPRGWSPPVEPVTPSYHSTSSAEPYIPPPIGSAPANLVASQPLTPAIGGASLPPIPPPIGGYPAYAALQPGSIPPPIGSKPPVAPYAPPLGADPETLLASQPISPPIGSAPAAMLGGTMPPPVGWAPSTRPEHQMIRPPIGGPPAP
ncbi:MULTISPECIES: hypothetical protein [unclassified Leptolyngbya]|nr:MULTISPECIES: hypothetical protein [unclassified Leptolyngbya]MBD1911559.1 hypothetical protein [Leptolyngbya sp. FACHB-8]MBD2155593.1 hypothetical protein [Leptolyngbya sp. FACHB-16]